MSGYAVARVLPQQIAEQRARRVLSVFVLFGGSRSVRGSRRRGRGGRRGGVHGERIHFFFKTGCLLYKPKRVLHSRESPYKMLALWTLFFIYTIKYLKNVPRGRRCCGATTRSLGSLGACLRRVARATPTTSFFGLGRPASRARRRSGRRSDRRSDRRSSRGRAWSTPAPRSDRVIRPFPAIS